MPLSTTLQKLLCCTTGIQEEDEMEAPARRPLPEHAQAGPEPVHAGPAPAQAGRPYRDYVEREAERFRRDIENDGSLDEPGRQETGAAALPGPSWSQRRMSDPGPGPALTREQMAVHVAQMYLVKKGFIKPPYSRLEACPDYAEALVQLADDTGLLAREIPLPDHPAPKHPIIYYAIDTATGQPVPREDALIRGDYVYTRTGKRLTEADYIYPWRGTGSELTSSDLASRGWDACYSQQQAGDKVEIEVHWLIRSFSIPIGTMSSRIEDFHFSPNPPQQTGDTAGSRRERRGRGTRRTAASGTRGSSAGAAGMVFF